jgi:cobaltochelatase CobS
MASETSAPAENGSLPDITISVAQSFGIDCDMQVPAYSHPREHVPDIDEAYRFDRDTTLAILAGFAYNRRVMIQGYHGTGKSTHIEQVAARLNWPCIRINLDSHISRIDLIGGDASCCGDAAGDRVPRGAAALRCSGPRRPGLRRIRRRRPDVMFVIQRVLEVEGKLTLLTRTRSSGPIPPSALLHGQHRGTGRPRPASITAPSRSNQGQRWTVGTS